MAAKKPLYGNHFQRIREEISKLSAIDIALIFAFTASHENHTQ
ncbi:hypothetical protein [Pantoea vagans]